MRIAWFLAVKFLREGRSQSLLIAAGAAVGVGVIVFLTALIGGVQASLIEQTLGSQPHLTLRPKKEEARPLRASSASEVVVRRVELPTQRSRLITDWQELVRSLDADPEVTAVSPAVTGPGFANRGGVNKAVTITGIDLARYRKTYPIAKKLQAGQLDVEGDRCLIGVDLAADLGIGVGDKLRVRSAGTSDGIFTVGGLFDYGNREINRRLLLVSIRSAQTLLDLSSGVSIVEVRVRNFFAAEVTASLLAARNDLEGESWTKVNGELLVALRSQSSSTNLISAFVILGVGIALASVLVIAVIQRGKQIGILRAMGATRRMVLQIFVIQGVLIGLFAAIFGSLMGAALAYGFERGTAAPDGSSLYPVTLGFALFSQAFAVAFATGLFGSILPARRASRLDPAVAIRGD